MNPQATFSHIVAANLSYWRNRLQTAAPSQPIALIPERANLRRAVVLGQQHPTTRRSAIELFSDLLPFIDSWGAWLDWLPLLETLLPSTHDAIQRANLLELLGTAKRRLGPAPEAIAHYAEAIALMRGVDNQYEVARLQQGLCGAYFRNYQYAEAEQAGQVALNLFIELGKADSAQAASVWQLLGLIASMRGDWPAAEKQLRRAVELWRVYGLPAPLGRTLMQLAKTCSAQQRLEEAFALYVEAEQVLTPSEAAIEKLELALARGTFHFEQGQWGLSEQCFLSADSDFLRRSPYLLMRGDVSNNLGNVYLAQGRLAEAEARLRGAAQLYRQAHSGVNLGNALCTLAETLMRQGQAAAASPCYTEALTLFQHYPDDAFARHLYRKYREQAIAFGVLAEEHYPAELPKT